VKAVYPLPEAVDSKPRAWNIESSNRHGPRVFLKHKLLMVPLDGSSQSRVTRSHELGHIKWSPPRPEVAASRNKLSLDVVQATEDLRINTKLVSVGVDTSSGSLGNEVIEAYANDLLKAKDIRYLILSMVSIIGLGQNEDTFRDKLQEHDIGKKVIEIADMARKIMWDRGNPLFRDTIRTAKWLQAILEGTNPPASTKLPWDLTERRGGGDGLDRLMKIIKDFGATRNATRKVPWGKMKIETPPRVHRVNGYMGKGKRASDEGVVPTRPHRLLIDGRVFSRVRRQHGGSVLVDCSGSMSLEPKDLKKILSHSPGATVACYSGNVRDGVLRVLAQDGRQVSDEFVAAPAGGANVIDGPALRDWLSKQSKPRIWVCDGQVTGCGDRQSALNTLECEAVCRRSGIVRQDNVGLAVDLLKKLSRSRK